MGELSGTFQINENEKIHNWYPYIAGYSANLIRDAIQKYNLDKNCTVLDHFCGVGTTNVECLKNNINSIGIELNPLTCLIARVKTNWSIDEDEIYIYLRRIQELFVSSKIKNYEKKKVLEKVFSQKVYNQLCFIKEQIGNIKKESLRDFLKLALIRILKKVSNCENFAPYYQYKEKPLEDALVMEYFKESVQQMITDISSLKTSAKADIFCADSRDLNFIKDGSIDFVITSPPYLNNWEYTWITRIEIFFMDFASNIQDINRNIRKDLVKSSTFLMQSTNKNPVLSIDNEALKSQIQILAKELNDYRIKNNKQYKYDVITLEYFNDMYLILKQIYKKMKKDSYCLYVVGDSALYNVYIPVDDLIGKIGEAIGFKYEGLEILRKRRATRHKKELRESIVILKKVKNDRN